MNYLIKLQEMAREIETIKKYNGYYYKVSDVITILVVGLLCNLRSAHEIYQWSRSKTVCGVLVEHFGIIKLPCCYSPFMNILGNIKTDSLDKIFMQWCKMIIEGQMKGKTIAIDGTTICTTASMQSFDSPLHIVFAYVSKYGLTIGQIAMSSKSNEIPATQALIKMIEVQGALVVADAPNCQRTTAKAVIDGSGDYLLAVKENQKDLYRDIELLFQTESGTFKSFKKSEKGHGRIETRTAWVSLDVEWYENRKRWSHLSCFGAVERVSQTKGKTKPKNSILHFKSQANSKRFTNVFPQRMGYREYALDFGCDFQRGQNYAYGNRRTTHLKHFTENSTKCHKNGVCEEKSVK